jgi:hypothetical protein
MDIPAEFLSAATNAFEANKRLADRAVAQVPDEKLHVPLDENTNSIAVIMKHVAGNLISRWTDFLTTDGEKPGHNRDDEFVDFFSSRAELLERWESGWACLREALQALKPEDFGKTALIRGEPHSVPLASSWGIPVTTSGRSFKLDSQGWIRPVQPGELGPDREVAFVAHVGIVYLRHAMCIVRAWVPRTFVLQKGRL